MGSVPAQVQNGSERFICHPSKCFMKAQSQHSSKKRDLLATVNFTRHFNHYLLGRKFQFVTDHRALQWLHNFKDPDDQTARWLEKVAAFEYEIVYRKGKSIGLTDVMSSIPSQDTTTDRAHAPTRVAKAKHPTQITTKQVTQNGPTVPERARKKTSHSPQKAN